MTSAHQLCETISDPWQRLGFEIELLAPEGASRLSLAEELSRRLAGEVRTVFHVDTELSMVKGRPVFHHLTKGFEVYDRHGQVRCLLVDDVTIVTDLDRNAAPHAGWFRILSDERRLLRLIARHTDPNDAAAKVLQPIAKLFGSQVEPRPDGRFRLDDLDGATVAMVAPQLGDRQRVCEIITPPIVHDHADALEELLEPARDLGFTIPTEAAVHVHLDAEPFRSPALFAELVSAFCNDRDELWRSVGTNPRCRRLGPLPAELLDAVLTAGFEQRSWAETEVWLKTLPLTKYSDLNLVNLRDHTVGKDTVEIRILPGAIDAKVILDGVGKIRERVANP